MNERETQTAGTTGRSQTTRRARRPPAEGPADPRGAARLGLNRGFWGYAIGDSLEGLPRGAVFLHDMHGLAMRQYEREGRWPKGAKPSSASRAGAGYLFYEKHMLADELPVWERMGTAPARVIELHDVPLTAVYQR